MMVILSRPLFAAVPRMAPNTTPGFSAAGTVAPQAWTISSVRFRNFTTSMPIMAAGTIPKFDNAE